MDGTELAALRSVVIDLIGLAAVQMPGDIEDLRGIADAGTYDGSISDAYRLMLQHKVRLYDQGISHAEILRDVIPT